MARVRYFIIFRKTSAVCFFFEVYYVFVAQKLKILENVKQFFLAWTLATSATSQEAQVLTSATSIVSQILAEDTSFHMKYCFLTKVKIWQL